MYVGICPHHVLRPIHTVVFTVLLQSMRQSSGGSKVPPPPSMVANLLSAWVELEHEFMDVYAEHKAVVFAVYAIGLIAGVCACVCVCVSHQRHV